MHVMCVLRHLWHCKPELTDRCIYLTKLLLKPVFVLVGASAEA